MMPVYDVGQLFPQYAGDVTDRLVSDYERRSQREAEGFDKPFHPLDWEPMPDTRLVQFLLHSSTKESLSPYISPTFIVDSLKTVTSYRDSLNTVVSSQDDVLDALHRCRERLVEVECMLQRLERLALRPFPDIPMDLARSIIEFSASTSKGQACVLSLISKEVCSWVDPFIFSQINHIDSWSDSRVFFDETGRRSDQGERLLPEPLSSRMSRALERTTVYTLRQADPRAQNVPPGMNEIERLFINCPNLRTLWLPHTERLGIDKLAAVFPSNLTQLACSASAFEVSYSPIPFNNPIYQQITHLYLVNRMIPASDYSRLSSLKNLTHMRVRYSSFDFPLTQLQSRFFPHLPSSIALVVLELNQSTADNGLRDVRDGKYDRRILIGRNVRAWPGYGKADEGRLLEEYILPIADSTGYEEHIWGLNHPNSVWNRGSRLLEARNRAFGV